MNSQDKIAIENLIVIASYMKDNSVLQDKDEKILLESMSRCASLIDYDLSTIINESVVLSDLDSFDVDAIINAVKNRKNI
tara:strand:- start:1356 stop:1595 length:240 start_codon:yes stop_codon:yes gene_type:complete